LLEHVLALPLQLILDKLRVPIGVDGDGRRARLEMNAVVEVAQWRNPGGNGEYAVEVPEQGGHQVRGCHGVE
jgi:hypothetical protein